MPLTRKANWQSILQNYLLIHQDTSFQYGSFDCCLFVCDCVHAMTDVDPAAGFRGNYKSRKEACEAIRRRTGRLTVKAVVDTITAELEMPEIPVLHAQRGDVCLIKRGRDYSLGIISLSGREILAAAASGIVRLPFTSATKVYRV